MGTWREGHEDRYDPIIIEEAEEILKELQEKGKCNYVTENTIDESGVHPSVLHVCAAPSSEG